ncbi:glycosyl hydrolase [Namhaeicola litoreus]|uniref:Glycosyl hydrolase n=1 Tax=Namhaeicola litoreus TaxID=1052145 RepID=A0ABW3Y3D9_9FLAO
MKNIKYCFIFLLVFFGSWPFFGQEEKSLEENFKNPPERAKPRAWMHAMSSNMSKEGLTKDLDAIQKVGIGGILLFNVTHTIPKGKVLFNSDKHHELIRHAAEECERLGLSFGVHNSDGWTSSGGPWITPENSMKMIVWTEEIVDGGEVLLNLNRPTAREDFYKDVAVLAYPAFSSELEDNKIKPLITSSDLKLDTGLISDGNWDKPTVLHSSLENKNWIQFDFGKPYGIQSIHMALTKTIAGSRKSTLFCSDDGVDFKKVKTFDLKRLSKREFAIEESFPEITARFFRIETEDDYEIMELRFSKRMNYVNYLAKTSLFKIENDRLAPIKTDESVEIIKKNTILDLTSLMNQNGLLKANLPQGKWTVMRFGFTTTGAVNSPASDEGRGLELDKMDKKALKIHYDAYVGKVVKNSKDTAPNALQYLEIDSFEVGGQNWTDDYASIFEKTYGYSIIPFLPLYSGKLVESAEVSDEILWEIRKLNSDLITKNYFGYFTELTHNDGLISYIEPYSFNAPFNELDAGKETDIPMGEFWMHQRYQTETAVSSARIYGRKIVSAESFSAQSNINWRGHPGFSKTTGDMAWILGINEFMFHRFAHQANTHVKPGMTMSQWGSHIDRTQTWWENAGAEWFKYIARGSYLLRQGNPVSDLLIYVGEGSPNSITKRNSFSVEIPVEINFDNISTDALLNRVKVKNGELFLPEGTKYKALVLHNCERLTLNTLLKIHELAGKGIIIIGERPHKIAGYANTEQDKILFNKLLDEIWQKQKTFTTFDWHNVFKENGIQYDLVAKNEKSYLPYIHRSTPNEEIYFISNQDSIKHKIDLQFSLKGKIPELWNPMTGETKQIAYFKNNKEGTQMSLVLEGAESTFIVFRKSNVDQEHVIDLKTLASDAPVFSYNGKKGIDMDVSMNGNYSIKFFSGQEKNVDVTDLAQASLLKNLWIIAFSEESDIDQLKVDRLFDWTTSSNFDIKHYSGTANYKTSFSIKKSQIKENEKLILDLGEVNIAAKVILNGKEVSTLWVAPFKVDISKFVKVGENSLEIEVTNTWTNRLIGDEHYERTDMYSIDSYGNEIPNMPNWYTDNLPMPAGKRTTFSAYPFYNKNDDLMPSGLVGPVSIHTVRKISVTN